MTVTVTILEPASRLIPLAEAVKSLLAHAERPDIASVRAFHDIVSAMHSVCSQLRRCEEYGLSRTDLDDTLSELRAVCSNSPFQAHMLSWPRGYPGDFEIIQQICLHKNKAPRGTFAYWIEEYFLLCGMSQQHRHKVRRQAAEIASTIYEHKSRSGGARIAILACGSCPDLQEIQPHIADEPFGIVAVDMDEEAIATSKALLPQIVQRVDFLVGNVVKKSTELSRRGPFDLVVAGGLFDYLPDRIASLLIKIVVQKLLADQGRFFFTNMAEGNPFEDWTRYVGNWRLLQRDESQVAQLVQDAGISAAQLELDRDPTALAVLAMIRRATAQSQ